MSGTDRFDVWQEVLAWLGVAEADRRVAGLCLNANPPLYGAAAYHCQQAAEKWKRWMQRWQRQVELTRNNH
jgi:hypothetical protein